MNNHAPSVIIPLYNGEKTIGRTLKAFLNQDLPPREIIVVDDGSRDSGPRLVKQAAAQTAVPVRLLRGNHAGQSAATNLGWRAAGGELLHFSAQDITCPPGFLRKVVNRFQRYGRQWPRLMLLGHIAYPPELIDTPFMHTLQEKTSFQFGFYWIPDHLDVPGNFLYAPNFTTTSEVMQSLNGFDEDFPYGWQDTDLGLRFRAAGGRIVYDPLLRVHHHHHLTFAQFSLRQEQIGRDAPRFLHKHPDFLELSTLQEGCYVYFLEMKRLLSSALKLVRLAEEHPEIDLSGVDFPYQVHNDRGEKVPVLQAAYVLLLKYRFYKGVHDALREELGRHWLRDYAAAYQPPAHRPERRPLNLEL